MLPGEGCEKAASHTSCHFHQPLRLRLQSPDHLTDPLHLEGAQPMRRPGCLDLLQPLRRPTAGAAVLAVGGATALPAAAVSAWRAVVLARAVIWIASFTGVVLNRSVIGVSGGRHDVAQQGSRKGSSVVPQGGGPTCSLPHTRARIQGNNLVRHPPPPCDQP
jgi:hypothetical protein